MRVVYSFVLFLGLLCALPTGPATAQGGTEPVQTDSTIEVGDAAPSDMEIQTRLRKLLAEIDGYDRVRITVSEGVVRATGQVIDYTRQDQLGAIITRVAGVVAFENETEVSGTLQERLEPALDRISGRTRNLMANAQIFLVALSAFLVISVSGWYLTKRIGIWSRLAPNSFIADVYRAFARTAFVVLGIVLALDILNATALIGAVLGAAGVVGLALGFAVRDTVENFIASILLSLRQPFRPNDFVDIQGDQGTVARLTSRATILISPDGNHVRIPNATVFKGRIVNYTREPQRRFSFELGVDADADLAAALSVATAALIELPFVLPEPEVGAWVKDVGDSNVVLTFTGWVDQTQVNFAKARGEAIRIAKTALEAAGFGLPEPIYRLRVDGGAALGLPRDAQVEEIQPAMRKPAPPDPVHSAEELPEASDPTRVEDAQADAAARERSDQGSETNLLNTAQKTE